jgi:DNA polymerase-1
MINWTSTTITTNRQANAMLHLVNQIQPKIGAFDTETTGLHIILDKPFLFQFGFIDQERKNGWTFAVDLEKQPKLAEQVIKYWHIDAAALDIYLGHNVKFDMHMLTNVGFTFPKHNLSDTMFYIRYAHDALSPKNGGPPLGLKPYAAKYIDANAKSHDNLLQEERTAICKTYRNKLAQRLKAVGLKKLSELDIMFKDAIFDYNDLEPKLKAIYNTWIENDLPDYLQDLARKRMITSDDIRYDKLNRRNLIKYAHYDIIYTIETFLKCEPVLKERDNEVAIEFENKVIIPLYEMERTGFLADPDYIEERRVAVKSYIQQKRDILRELAGREIKINQHTLLKKVFNEYFHHELPSTNNEALLDELAKLKENSEENADIIKFIETIQDLRSLEKWYSTYIIRFQHQLSTGYNRLHTQIMQVGTVSGRVTSDFQQFPKEAILDDQGNELFHPRRMVKAPEGGRLVYMDYSQVELRITAEYTLLVGHPDLNLCRAYKPFQCL